MLGTDSTRLPGSRYPRSSQHLHALSRASFVVRRPDLLHVERRTSSHSARRSPCCTAFRSSDRLHNRLLSLRLRWRQRRQSWYQGRGLLLDVVSSARMVESDSVHGRGSLRPKAPDHQVLPYLPNPSGASRSARYSGCWRTWCQARGAEATISSDDRCHAWPQP